MEMRDIKLFLCSVQIITVSDNQSKFQMLTLFSGRLIGVPGSVTLRGTFRRISQPFQCFEFTEFLSLSRVENVPWCLIVVN